LTGGDPGGHTAPQPTLNRPTSASAIARRHASHHVLPQTLISDLLGRPEEAPVASTPPGSPATHLQLLKRNTGNTKRKTTRAAAAPPPERFVVPATADERPSSPRTQVVSKEEEEELLEFEARRPSFSLRAIVSSL